MRIAIATVQVPFTTGGAEVLTTQLKQELTKRGHIAEIVTVPFKWYPASALLHSMLMCRMIDLKEANHQKIDLVIAMKFPIYYLNHPNKVLWLMHQHRQAYDLWGTKYGNLQYSLEGREVKNLIAENDHKYLNTYKKIFTIGDMVSQRLKKYNNIDSSVLYPPGEDLNSLASESYGDYIFYPSRINELKRQRLLVESAKYIKSNLKIKIAGKGNEEEIKYLQKLICDNRLENKVELMGYISDADKNSLLSNALAVYYGPVDEDYGYVPIEAFYCSKPVIVHTDAGSPLAFVKENRNGWVIDPDPKLLAKTIDSIAANRDTAIKYGQQGHEDIVAKNINWDNVIEHLLK